MMGSGGMIVMDDRTCMVDVARYFLSFLVEESCGKCVPCREGSRRMLAILTRITAGQGEPDDLATLERLGRAMTRGSLCGLGKTAANPVLSTLRYFRHEYEGHIAEHRCPAAVCRALIAYTINAKCNGCTLCARVCPQRAITGEKKQPHVIDPAKCDRCGVCFQSCKFDAIDVA
jgi:ferredoxin